MKSCPLCIVFNTAGPGGQGATPHPLHTRTCTLWTQHKYAGLQLQDPRGGSILSLAFRAQPAPETALGRVSPGQAGAKHLSLPFSWAQNRGAVERAASLHSRHCLKENGGPCPPDGPLEGSACLALTLSPTSLVSASQEGKGQSRKMAPRAPPPELDWWRMGLVLPRNGAQMIPGTLPGQAVGVLPSPMAGGPSRALCIKW